MRKKLLLALLLAVGTMGAYAQTNINALTTGNVIVEEGETIQFYTTAPLLSTGNTYTLTCTAVPEGLETEDFSATATSAIGLLGLNVLYSDDSDFETPTQVGVYSYSYERESCIAIVGCSTQDNAFTIEVVPSVPLIY